MKAPVRPTLISVSRPLHGLGNRIRVLLGCAVLAQFEHRRLLYVWPTSDDFGAELSDLWHFDAGHRVPAGLAHALRLRYGFQNEAQTRVTGPTTTPLVKLIRTPREIELPPGAPSWRQALRELVPSDAIAAAVTEFFAEHLAGRPFVGVQIRAHAVSNDKTKQFSPVSWYLGRMREIATEQPDVTFFVSCDVPEVFEEVVAAIPGCVGIRDKGAYNSAEALRASVVDLYLLACSGYLLGPYFSSFIHLSEHLAGDVLTLETGHDPQQGPIDLSAAGLVNDPLRPAVRH